MRWQTFVALCLLSTGCGSDAEREAPIDEPTTATACLTRCPAAEGEAERCESCFENVGRCCYPDTPDIDGHIPGLAFNCAATLGCSACCDECAAMSCEEMRANGNCPVEAAP